MPEDKNEQLDTEALQAIIGAVVQGLNNATKGSDFDFSSPHQMPESLTDLIATSLENAGKHDEAAELRRSASEQLVEAREKAQEDMAAAAEDDDPDKPDPIRDNLRAAVGSFVAAKADEGKSEAEVMVDADFLSEHGPELAGRMLGAFAKALIPDDPLEMDVAVPDGEDGAKKDVKVKLDLGKILSGFLQPLVDEAEKTQGQGAEDSTEAESDDG